MPGEQSYDVVFITHAGCYDGTTAAWAWSEYAKDLSNVSTQYFYVPANAVEVPIEALSNKHVIFCDVSPTIEFLEKIIPVVDFVDIIDHHLTAHNRFKDYAPPSHVRINIDITECGSSLLISYFQIIEKMKKTLPHLSEVRDTVKALDLALTDMEPYFTISYRLTSLPHESLSLYMLHNEFSDKYKLIYLADKIRSLRIKDAQSQLRYVMSITLGPKKIAGYCVNTDLYHVSEVLRLMQAEDKNVSYLLAWTLDPKDPTKVRVSIRTNRNDVDVEEIARHYGGGGHRKASGFTMRLSDLLESIKSR